jgi:hypothetical protein
MGEVTRDDVRRACEAVGWEWEGDEVTLESAVDGHGLNRFYATEHEDRGNSNALALLRATGEHFEVIYRGVGWSVRIRAGNYYHSGCWHAEDTLREAAVRAVLALKEARHA